MSRHVRASTGHGEFLLLSEYNRSSTESFWLVWLVHKNTLCRWPRHAKMLPWSKDFGCHKYNAGQTEESEGEGNGPQWKWNHVPCTVCSGQVPLANNVSVSQMSSKQSDLTHSKSTRRHAFDVAAKQNNTTLHPRLKLACGKQSKSLLHHCLRYLCSDNF